MQPTVFESAYIGKGQKMSCGGLFRPLFPCTLGSLQRAANLLAKRLPEVTFSWGPVGIESSPLTVEAGHPAQQYREAKTALRISAVEEGFWVYFSHDFLDGYSYWRAVSELFRIAAGHSPEIFPAEREPLPKLPKPLRGRPGHLPNSGAGVEGVAHTKVFSITKDSFSRARRGPLRVQEYLAVLGAKAMGSAQNFITSTLIPGYEECFGHYSLYAGSVSDGQSFETLTPYPTFTLGMLKAQGDFECCLASSLPFGIDYIEMLDWFQAFPANQLARFQISSFREKYVASVSVNAGIASYEEIFSRFEDSFI